MELYDGKKKKKVTVLGEQSQEFEVDEEVDHDAGWEEEDEQEDEEMSDGV